MRSPWAPGSEISKSSGFSVSENLPKSYIYVMFSLNFWERIFKFVGFSGKSARRGPKNCSETLVFVTFRAKCKKVVKSWKSWKSGKFSSSVIRGCSQVVYIYAKSWFHLPWNFIENHEILKILEISRKSHLMPPTCHFPYKTQYI